MLTRNLARAWTVAALGLVWGLYGCGGRGAPAANASETPKQKTGDTEADAAKDEEMAAQIAKESSDEEPTKKSGDAKATDEVEQPQAAEGGPPKTDEARKQEIWKLIKARRESVLNCYKDARKKNAKIGVKLTIMFSLNPDGTFKEPPAASKERSDITDQQVITCAVETIKGIKFPPHPKGMQTTFYYPYGF